MNARASKLLEAAAEIARKELELEELRYRFRRMVDELPGEPRPRGRPAIWKPIRARALEAFGADHELPAGEIVHRLRDVPTEVVHTTLSKLAAQGVLVRVRWGVYRKAAAVLPP